MAALAVITVTWSMAAKATPQPAQWISDSNRPSVSISTNGRRRRRIPNPAFANNVPDCVILLSFKPRCGAFQV